MIALIYISVLLIIFYIINKNFYNSSDRVKNKTQKYELGVKYYPIQQETATKNYCNAYFELRVRTGWFWKPIYKFDDVNKQYETIYWFESNKSELESYKEQFSTYEKYIEFKNVQDKLYNIYKQSLKVTKII